jgi:VanZ family protein
MILTLLLGAALSAGIELSQYYEFERVVSAQDVYANSFGTLLGAIGGAVFGAQWRSPVLRQFADTPFPSLILAAWAGYQLFPFVPSLDVHEKWVAVRPLFANPHLTFFGLFRYTASWAVICALLEAIVGRNRSLRLFPVIAPGFIAAKFLIGGSIITWDQLIGAVAAFVLWFGWRSLSRARVIVLCGFLGLYVLSWRLEPFRFAQTAGAFNWIPFSSMMHGSIEVNIRSFLEKAFFYGSLIWLLTLTGLRLRTAAITVALLLLVTSMAEVFLPGRSADTTDAAMVLITAAIAALLMGRKSQSERSRLKTGDRSIHV